MSNGVVLSRRSMLLIWFRCLPICYAAETGLPPAFCAALFLAPSAVIGLFFLNKFGCCCRALCAIENGEELLGLERLLGIMILAPGSLM